jgi:ketosteroid isomerase-like protein
VAVVSAAENRELLRGVFAEMAVGNLRALSELMTDDFRWVFPGDWSWSGVWEPKAAVVHEMLRPMLAQLQPGYRIAADFLLAEDDRVVVQARGHGVTLGGVPYRQTYCFVFRVADGRLTEVVEHCDSALVERVLTCPPRTIDS